MADREQSEEWRAGVAPKSGESLTGVPLSVNRPPVESLRPWVARLVAAKIEGRPDSLIRCGMCNDLAYQRIVINGDWTATAKDGTGHYRDEPLLFGPHSRYMPLSCSGSVIAIGVGLRPGALTKLTGKSVEGLVDCIEREDALGLITSDLMSDYPPSGDPEDWLVALEAVLNEKIAELDPDPPDPISTAFEFASFANPNFVLSEFAESQGISLRKLERLSKRDFGLTPKQVLRRARALDLAAQLCGVADEEEAEQLILRFFDQSHLIREFAAFFGTTPHAFRSSPRPLMTLNVETRQARRLEELNRLKPGEHRPWTTEG